MIAHNYYIVLGVKYDATAEEIRMAYKGKCKALHPDVCDDPNATRLMQEVNEAYRVLSDKYLRYLYDKENGFADTVKDGFRPNEEDYCDAHSDTDSYVNSNWNRYTNPDTWYNFESDKKSDISWWIIVPAAVAFGQMLINIL
ncbi:MAG: J domain-containing protein [Bacteroidales bacterium]|nr:J domain-containing protein [Bacteroidales bacterium]